MDSEAVLSYWLGVRDEESPDEQRTASWFAADPEADEAIRVRFGPLVEQAIAGGLVEWERDPVDRAALIILLDQFQRNLNRSSPLAFAGDSRAIGILRGTTRHELGRLHPLERYFTVVPWMHSESLDDQRSGERAFGEGIEDVPAPFEPLFENGLRFATRHRVTIERFGRFPHRNRDLGRESTPEERAYLTENPEGF